MRGHGRESGRGKKRKREGCRTMESQRREARKREGEKESDSDRDTV